MQKTSKRFAQSLLAPTGLLPVGTRLYRRLNRRGRAELAYSFLGYIYNAWLTNFPSITVRLFYLRHILGYAIGKGSFVHMGCFLEGANIKIGKNTVVGRHCYLGGSGGTLAIKDNVSITARTYIFCATHDAQSPVFASVYGDVTLEERVWIGAGATIMPGVTVGRGAVLGALSLATKSIPDFTIWGGVPAKQIGVRNNNLDYTLDYRPWFN